MKTVGGEGGGKKGEKGRGNLIGPWKGRVSEWVVMKTVEVRKGEKKGGEKGRSNLRESFLMMVYLFLVVLDHGRVE